MAGTLAKLMTERMWRARMAFFFSFEESVFFASFDAASKKTAAQAVATAFRHNLLGTAQAASVPFVMAQESVYRRHFQAIHMAERIRALPLSGDKENAALVLLPS